MGKTALITGVTGQDGSYLAELLLDKGYTVHGLVRRSSSFNTERIDHIYQDPQAENRSFVLHHADLTDGVALVNLLRDLRPDEIYNLGAQSHVRVSFDAPLYTGDVTGLSTLRLLEAVRASGTEARIYQASSSEMFGSAPPPQSEHTLSTRAARTVARRSSATGRRSTTVRRTGCTPSTASCSTTSRRAAARPS